MVVSFLKGYFIFVIILMMIYALRHFIFSWNRLLGRQRIYYNDIYSSRMKSISVLIPMHNEEQVLDYVLESLLACDYDRDRLEIIPINDNSTDRTKEMLDEYHRKYEFIRPIHRNCPDRGKPVGLNDAMKVATGEIIIVFDADYRPAKDMLKQLAIAFEDPEVGAVMGRVIPYNTNTNLLTRLINLERSGGYQVDQQARYNLRTIPQYGGTVGGFRKDVMMEMGGFNPLVLAEDTELTYRLYTHGWKVIYANSAECYEEAPETWKVRGRQIRRWARGHNQVMFRYLVPTIFSTQMTLREKFDGILLLGVYAVPFLLMLGWLDCYALFFLGEMNLFKDWWALLSVISKHNVTVVENLIIQGDLRSHKKVRLCDGAVVCGNVFAEGDIWLGRNATVLGSVFSQGSIHFEKRASAGQMGKICSVIARDNVVFEGENFVFGYVNCERPGHVERRPDDGAPEPAIMQMKTQHGRRHLTFNSLFDFQHVDWQGYRRESELLDAVIPDGAEKIQKSFFFACPVLTKVTLPHTIQEIGDYAFADCVMLTDITPLDMMPLTGIGVSSFENCEKLPSVHFPATLRRLGGGAFAGCAGLAEAVLPENSVLEKIGDHCFRGCTRLTEMRLPDTVTYVGVSAFRECAALTRVSVPETVREQEGVKELLERGVEVEFRPVPPSAETPEDIPADVPAAALPPAGQISAQG